MEIEGLLDSPLILAEREDGAEKLLLKVDGPGNYRLEHQIDVACGWELRRVIDEDLCAGAQLHLIDDSWRRRDEREIEFALETLLNDLHMEETEVSAAEAEAERSGAFRLER